MIYIYALLNSPTNIFYVGQTVDPMRRLGEHRRGYGRNIILRVLQEASSQEEANALEIAWIKELRRRYILKNKKHNDWMETTPWYKEALQRIAASEKAPV